MKTKHIVITLVTLWALMIAFLSLLLWNIWSVVPGAEPQATAQQDFKILYIEYGDWIVADPQDGTKVYRVPMEQVFQYDLDVMPNDLVTIYADDQDNILHIERSE